MRTALLLIMLAVSTTLLNADTLQYTVTTEGTGFLYSFTLTNTGDTGGMVFDLFISIPEDLGSIDTTSIGTPVGWGDPTGGLVFFGPTTPGSSFIEWADDASGLYDIGINGSLQGFSFVSNELVPSAIMFALNGTAIFNGAEQVSAIPEPSSLSLSITVIAILIATHLLRKLSASQATRGESWEHRT